MQRFIQSAVNQPISVAVGVILAVIAGLLAVTRVAVQMTPSVDSTVVSVATAWENASAAEIESDVIEQQERMLSELSNLISMTSVSQAGRGQVRLEFRTGTDIEQAMAEVDQKLSQVPGYPEGVDKPSIEGIDPDSVDYIAWIGLSSTDTGFDATTLYDFMHRRIKPRMEQVPGVSEAGVRGAREAEVQIRVDPIALAQRQITYAQLIDAIRISNANFSGGRLPEGKNDLRMRAVGRFHDPATVGDLVIRRDAAGPIYLSDVAEVVPTYKEMNEWVRARGVRMPFFNYQLAHGANLLETMAAIQEEVDRLNAPGGMLEAEANRLGLNGKLELVQTYDSSTYVEDAIALVQSNIFVGGGLAVFTLLLFLRSLRTIGIIAIAIPISVVASLAVLVMLGRSINIISLAGMAFATGMVVDNAIVVIENIYRHLEMGKSVRKASIEGAQEVASAVMASTATTMVVFVPILMIQDAAGQLFRDIALAIMAAVGLSLVVSLTVIPAGAALVLKDRPPEGAPEPANSAATSKTTKVSKLRRVARAVLDAPTWISSIVHMLTARWSTRIAVVVTFIAVTTGGIAWLMPPMDYLPRGNRNVVFGILIPPPGYNLDQLSEIGDRLEAQIRPAWEVTQDKFGAEPLMRGGPSPETDERVAVMGRDGVEIIPPALEHYFLVAWDGLVFQVAIAEDNKTITDAVSMMDAAVDGGTAPDVLSFAFQFPLFQNGGRTGSAIKIDLTGQDLDAVSQSAGALMMKLFEAFGPGTVQPEPANFLLPTPEITITPNDERLRDLNMARRDVGLAVQINGDGLILPRQFEVGGELKDLKIITPAALGQDPITAMMNAPIATPATASEEGMSVDLASLASVDRTREADRIKHVDRQRAVTLQFTPPPGVPLGDAIDQVQSMIQELRDQDAIDPGVEVHQAGSAGKLADIRQALLGDGTLTGTVGSSLFLAFLIVYLVMVVLFQSWSYPVVIMVSVPLATLGGFIGLAIVHAWSVADRYLPVQNLDVLTLLGFVILAGVVVNNAILIVEQTLNFMRQDESLSPREAIKASVHSRVRPILMSTMTSVGGMLPLVLMPGSGSELYRGLGAVIVGGLALSTVFTLILVPVLLSILLQLKNQACACELCQPLWWQARSGHRLSGDRR